MRISKWHENVEEVQIQFKKQKELRTEGVFQRLIDTFTLLGTASAFSSFLPVFEGTDIEFIPNDYIFLKDSEYVKLKDLIGFDSTNYERSLQSAFGNKLILCLFIANSTSLPTDILRSYLIIFASSSLARYRPVLWNSIFLGEKPEQAGFALQYRDALLEYTMGKKAQTLDYLNQVERVFRSIIEGKFTLKKRR